MRRSFFTLFFLAFLVFTCSAEAQNRRRLTPKIRIPAAAAKLPNTAVVVDERLSVLRAEPSFYAPVVQRMRRGRTVMISGSRQADGVTFYRVADAPNYGWIQGEAIAGRFRPGDDARLANLVQASEGFEQIERAAIFLDTFNDSPLRPAILLLLGDLMEENALKLSAEATRRLDRREMAASGAPLHSFYLNYVSLDRYRRLGINFVFNPEAKLLHYDGAGWREIIRKAPKSAEAVEAQKRLASLREKMGQKPPVF